MSILIDGTDRLYRSANLPDYNSPHSACVWLYGTALAPNNTDYTRLLNIEAATDGGFDLIGVVNSSGTLNLQLDVWNATSGGYTPVTGSVITNNTWYHLAMVRESNASLKLYLNGALDATNTQSVSTRAVAAVVEFLRQGTAFDTGEGRVFGYKEWATSLTAAEILNEMRHIRPCRFPNLNAWHPLTGSASDVGDLSGLARVFNTAGTPTLADNPPVSW